MTTYVHYQYNYNIAIQYTYLLKLVILNLPVKTT